MNSSYTNLIIFIALIIIGMYVITVFTPYNKECHPRPQKVIECRDGFYCISKSVVDFECNDFDDHIPGVLE